MMQSNEYSAYDAYDYGVSGNMLSEQPEDDPLMMVAPQQGVGRPMDVNFDDPKIANLPRVLLMGPRRGGKTSIQRVVFQKMSPHETLFRLEATQTLERAVVDHTPLCRFTIWDFPGDYYGGERTNHNGSRVDDDNEDVHNAGHHDNIMATTTAAEIFAGSSTSLIFVVDAQDEPYDHVLQSFTNAVTKALELNPNIVVEVFINKVDGELFLSDESKFDCRRDIMTQVTDELTDAGVSPDSIQIRYHLTSIYDHSIYEALSRVVQRLIPQLQPTLENLLNVLVSTCSMEKAYLFDVVSKLYISTDPGPVDMQSVELCSDMIDVVLDVSGIYGLGPSHLDFLGGMVGGGNISTMGVGTTEMLSLGGSAAATDPANSNHEIPHDHVVDPSSMSANNNKESSCNSIPSSGGQPTDELVGTLISQAPAEDLEEEMVDPDSAYDSESASVIRLSNGMVLYLKEVDTMLALVCITRSENFRKKSLINYNIGCLKRALRALVAQPTVAT